MSFQWFRKRKRKEEDLAAFNRNRKHIKGNHGQVFRVCAVCGKRHGVTYGFRNTLRFHGIEGDKATIACIRALARKPPKPPAGG